MNSGVTKLRGPSVTTAWFCKQRLLVHSPWPPLHLLTLAGMGLQVWNQVAGTQTIWPTKPKMFTICPLLESLLSPLLAQPFACLHSLYSFLLECSCSFILAMLYSMWDLGSPTRNQTCAPCTRVLTTGPPGNSLACFLDVISHI